MQITPTGGSGAAGTGVSEAKLATPGAGATPPAAAINTTALTSALAASVFADSVTVRELAVSDLLKLSQILQPSRPPERIAQVDNLIRQTVAAIAEGRLEWAVGRVIEAAVADPSRIDELRAKPEFAAIRSNVEQLIGRLTNVAKMDAETKLGAAEQLIEDSGVKRLPQWETSPEALITLGHRLIEAGGYANYIKTAELAGTLQSAYWGATVVEPGGPGAAAGAKAALKTDEAGAVRRKAGANAALAYQAWDSLRVKLPQKVKSLWLRAPLLVILGAWLVVGASGLLFSRVVRALSPQSGIGSAGELITEVWVVGLLGAVAFGFWARVRPPRE